MSSLPSSEYDLVEDLVARVLSAVEEARDGVLDAIRDEHPELEDEVLDALEKLERFERGESGLHSVLDSADAEEAFPTADPTARYEKLAQHAVGGMGEIWRVQDRQLGRIVAMKILHPRSTRLAEDSLTSALSLRDLRRFYEEARILGQLDHPGVPAVHDVGRDDERRPFFTMPFVRGETLVQVFEKYHASVDGWSLRRCLDILVKVCDTLAHAHSRGVLHRDLKPSNIMVGRFGEVYVMDWGIAKVLDEKQLAPLPETSEFHLEGSDEETPDRTPLETVNGVIVGTPQYMAPEQALQKRETLGVAVDIYAVGALLYELLVGRAPYQDGRNERTPQEILRAVREGPPEPAFELSPDSPEELLAICAKAMARDIEDRYEGMQELGGDLRNFLDGNVVHAHRTGPIARVTKWFQRNAAIGSTIAIAVIYAVVALFMFVRRTQSDYEALLGERERATRAFTLLQYSRMSANVERLQARVERDFRPLAMHRLAAMEFWCEEAAELAELYGRLKDDLDRLRLDSSVTATADGPALANFGGQTGFGEETRQEEYDLLTELRHEVRGFFEGPEEGLLGKTYYEVSRAVQALRRVQRLQERPPPGFPTWETARAEIQRSARYGGLDLPQQPHLVPLGENPATGLWEFADVLSGELPRRGENGRWLLGDRSGLIFVLVPGGSAEVGFRSGPDQFVSPRPDEFPAHAVALEPFFLSKYELTREQWRRLTGLEGETTEDAASARLFGLPATGLEWALTDAVLRASGMSLPTEVQWEYACRAGGPGPWARGPLDVNLGEQSTHGATAPTPVGHWPPNDFGLYDVHGNALEWCRDVYVDYGVPARPGDGLRDPGDESLPRVLRGGSYAQGLDAARCSARHQAPRLTAHPTYGVRPARALH